MHQQKLKKEENNKEIKNNNEIYEKGKKEKEKEE